MNTSSGNIVSNMKKNTGQKVIGSTLPHDLSLKCRSSLKATGIIDIENFNEQTITAYTKEEKLIITGENLHISKLNLEQSELCVNGKICSLEYKEKSKTSANSSKESFFSKIFK